MQKTNIRLLVIVIITAAIIAGTTTSLSAATSAFAMRNCNEEGTICTGGSGCGRTATICTSPSDIPGGGGGRETGGLEGSSLSGGSGFNADTAVGGFGLHIFDNGVTVGSDFRGVHPK
jgi:outer membrane lipoprotein SlyB